MQRVCMVMRARDSRGTSNPLRRVIYLAFNLAGAPHCPLPIAHCHAWASAWACPKWPSQLTFRVSIIEYPKGKHFNKPISKSPPHLDRNTFSLIILNHLSPQTLHRVWYALPLMPIHLSLPPGCCWHATLQPFSLTEPNLSAGSAPVTGLRTAAPWPNSSTSLDGTLQVA